MRIFKFDYVNGITEQIQGKDWADVSYITPSPDKVVNRVKRFLKSHSDCEVRVNGSIVEIENESSIRCTEWSF